MIIIFAFGGLLVSAGVTYFVMTPKYDSSALILVNQKDNTNVATQYNAVQTDLQMINTYKDIITEPVILDQAAKDLHKSGRFSGTASDLKAALTISNNENSQVVNVTAEATSPYVARDIANAVTKVFQNKITKIMANAKNVSIISAAKLQTNAVSPRKAINLAVGLLAGLVLGILLAFVRELTDKTVKAPDFITDTLGLPLLGTVYNIDSRDLKFGQARSAHGKNARRTRNGGER
ncbi:chain length regulator [Lacticaseibacillus manihotivorans DSM 13343 = JCM 12514]|uniref:Capsular polysaccharide biosynthesis protein CpsC n=2 Tax=Lacticaseibacillus manihotivorans TaxID=88233 RepID=A0A0R1QM81_9LACO|nr:chain length regulator [Lacticaseibacillus manihotivorans DSM 13343 = JCM 12514]